MPSYGFFEPVVIFTLLNVTMALGLYITVLSGQGLPIPESSDSRLVRLIKDVGPGADAVEADQAAEDGGVAEDGVFDVEGIGLAVTPF